MDRDEIRRRSAGEYGRWWCDRLPEVLRAARLGAGLTGYRLEKRSGIARETIRKIEAGETRPALFVVATLARGIGIPLPQLLRRVGRTTQPAKGKLLSQGEKRAHSPRQKRRE